MASTWVTMSSQGRGLFLRLVYPFSTASAASAAQFSGEEWLHHQDIGVQSRTLGPISWCTGTSRILPTTSNRAICRPAPRLSSFINSAGLRPTARSTVTSVTRP